MSFRSWLQLLGLNARSGKQRKRRPAPARKHKEFRPGVEALEDRMIPSVSQPIVAIVNAPTDSIEGKSISLGSNVDDPGAAVTSYQWRVTRNGTLFAGGTHSTFGF